MRFFAALTTLLCLLALTALIQADDNFHLCKVYGQVRHVGDIGDNLKESFEAVIRETLTSDPVSSEQLEKLKISNRYADAFYTTAESAKAGMALLSGSKRVTHSILDAMNADSGSFDGYFTELTFPLWGRYENYCIEIQRTCFNGELDGDETDIDCGGSCLPCARGQSCLVNSDCADGPCKAEYEGAPPTCSRSENSSFRNFQMYSSIGMILLGLLFVVM